MSDEDHAQAIKDIFKQYNVPANIQYPPPAICELCKKGCTSRLMLLDWIVCEECSEKLKKRIKLILDFQ